MQRFGGRIEAGLAEMFPGTVTIEEVEYECACSGGRVFREFGEDGLVKTRRVFLLRVRKALLPVGEVPAIGDRVSWTPEGGTERQGRVVEVPDRPEEVGWTLRVEET
jgi:hypothetical protein